jgi:hypothetical protein
VLASLGVLRRRGRRGGGGKGHLICTSTASLSFRGRSRTNWRAPPASPAGHQGPYRAHRCGCGAFVGEALRKPAWGALVARGALSMPNVAHGARERLIEDLRRAAASGRLGDVTPEFALEFAIGLVLQAMQAAAEGRIARASAAGRCGEPARDRSEPGRGGRDRAARVRLAHARRTAAVKRLTQALGRRNENHGRQPRPIHLERRSALGRRAGEWRRAAGGRLSDHSRADRARRGRLARRGRPTPGWKPSNSCR